MEEVHQNMDSRNQIIKDDEIDLIEVATTIWAGRKFILKVTGIFLIIGLIIAFGSKVEYEASCKLMPESQEGMKSNLGGLGSLAGLAGINLDMSGAGALTPELYPEIVRSVPFQLDLIHQPIRFDKLDSTISSYVYFTKYDNPSLLGFLKSYTIGLPGKIKSLFPSQKEISGQEEENDLIYLSKRDWGMIEGFRERIDVSVDNQTGIISITVNMPDPYAAAKVTDDLVHKLTREITKYKIEKVKANLEFIEQRYNEAENVYQAKQSQVAQFTDRNKNVTSSLVQTEYQRLQNDMNITFEVYKGLANQLEQARIKVKEETPVFTILEPVRVPTDKIKPQRKLILMVSIFLGIVISVTATLIKDQFLKKYK